MPDKLLINGKALLHCSIHSEKSVETKAMAP
jgi:hypothetical protein